MTGFKIDITEGEYNNRTVSGEFTALSPVKFGTRGWFVKVPGHEVQAGSRTSNVILTEAVAKNVKDQIAAQATETDNGELINVPQDPPEVALARMVDTFEILNEMVDAAAQGHVDGLVVFGPPGVGKSWNVIHTLKEYSIDKELAGEEPRHVVHNGYMTTLHLYMALWECREKGKILVLDDIDSIFAEPESLNLLKAALDTTDERIISYASDSKALADAGIDNRFEFEGSVIFITNIDFELSRGKIGDHLDAIISRCHYLDLTIDTKRDKFLWLKYVTLEQGMLKRKGVDNEQAQEILNFVEENLDAMRELSLRMVLKLADLRKVSGKFDWKRRAQVTCLKRKH